MYNGVMYKEEICAVCIEADVEVDKPNNNGVTRLMAAARDGVTGCCCWTMAQTLKGRMWKAARLSCGP